MAVSVFWASSLLLLCVAATAVAEERTYIISMVKSEMPSAYISHEHWYTSVVASLKEVTTEESSQRHMVHVYDTVFHGFSAKLSPEQAAAIEKVPGFLGMFPDKARQLHTTRTPQFLGLNSSYGLWPRSNYGSDVIIGVLDTGIWPESKSFTDHRIGPVPRHWKGLCQVGPGFNASLCNRKLVGARYFVKGYEAMSGPMNETLEFRSPRDNDGHGTHTASTAAGRYVYRASLLGYAFGMAKGVAPKARIAAYKVCWLSGCFDSDILAAFDQAVADGVNVISLSVGGSVVPYYLDSISLGAFGAMERGVFVSASGGNDGPADLTVTNVSPWITTVGAGTLDRDFPADVKLGNGAVVSGASLYSGAGLARRMLGLVYAGDAAYQKNGSDSYSSSLCLDGSLDPELVKGKIVLCDRGNNARVAKGAAVMKAGGVGMILANSAVDGEGLVADAHVLPATAVGSNEGNIIKQYIASSKNPVATIVFHGTVLGVKPAPVLASFSARGPNAETPEILKPDLIAPGVNILAAWTGAVGPSGLSNDRRIVRFNIISGTSMACPHVSGLAALIQGAHPDWSPAAIKSSLMTSAYVTDNKGRVIVDEATGNTSTAFDFGSGYVNPENAMDPGLVYDIALQDYVDFLCSLNYTNKAIRVIARRKVACSGQQMKPGDLNYPSFSAVFDQTGSSSLTTTFTRTVTNVGPAKSVYKVKIQAPAGVMITVKPDVLSFLKVQEKQSFTVTVSTHAVDLLPGDSEIVFGMLSWSDGKRVVQSPIAITRQEPY
eukprot:c25009_g1_i2 orf=549-2870(+)